jgi:hypothetical protein
MMEVRSPNVYAKPDAKEPTFVMTQTPAPPTSATPKARLAPMSLSTAMTQTPAPLTCVIQKAAPPKWSKDAA